MNTDELINYDAVSKTVWTTLCRAANEAIIRSLNSGRMGSRSQTQQFFKKKIAGAPRLVIAGKVEGPDNLVRRSSTSRSDSHGGFDNDPETMNSTLRRLLRADPVRP